MPPPCAVSGPSASCLPRPQIALAAAERAIGLLSADIALAEEPYAIWADPAREQLRRLLRRGRLTAAEAALAIGEAGSAARYAEAALAADPLDETACRWYMSASAAAERPGRWWPTRRFAERSPGNWAPIPHRRRRSSTWLSCVSRIVTGRLGTRPVRPIQTVQSRIRE